ncbi:MAG: N-acetylmuramoyl-L-alanine amidase [Patescibacteria group bacterium]|nr:N-acetylmuramoyl-L-alanine amidase [Patescibacteria group bacterium]MDD4304775.1 N-acetylmuramoyl-L-alanine amidase [Patescibacteria group bacterium]MDD4695486.1 N-acetylmuramoyl-L-alanine amidase [Patescibacteria group bacterium]
MKKFVIYLIYLFIFILFPFPIVFAQQDYFYDANGQQIYYNPTNGEQTIYSPDWQQEQDAIQQYNNQQISNEYRREVCWDTCKTSCNALYERDLGNKNSLGNKWSNCTEGYNCCVSLCKLKGGTCKTSCSTDNEKIDPAKCETGLCCVSKANTESEAKKNLFKPEVPIPGFQDEVEISPDLLATYISAVYNYVLYLAGVMAVIVIMIGGFQWVSAGGNESKIGEAKERIVGAIIGLVITLGSFLLLKTINPNLVVTKSLNVGIIEPVEIPEGTSSELNSASAIRNRTEYIIIHTAAGIMTRDAVNNYHLSLGWRGGIGYNRYIERDGRVVDGRGDDKVGAHATNYNSKSVGVSYSGCAEWQSNRHTSNQDLVTAVNNETIKEIQLVALINEIKRLQSKYDIPKNMVVGHNELGVPKACPCLNMDQIRSRINQ